ncbi:hypothetical protein SLU01_23700 [Sporosarcina luteola]|uniref:Uncharacterized protein n=1 Tax=Sporosarcina luteola TaxID=582850 RepID=A0A511Z9F3_9BACL|nr:hypothetical protein SLU01_23700 [Sporosarcina luteola]
MTRRRDNISKYISVFFLTLIASVVLYFVFGNLFDGGDYAETAIYTFGTIIVILLSFLISLMYYAINLLKRKI